MFKIENYEYLIPIIKNPWTEKSTIFNNCIKANGQNSSLVFPNKELCSQLDKLMKIEAKAISGVLKGTHYKKYAEVIAYRNNYRIFPVSNPFEPNTDYYIRNDNKYILSVDLIHGHFEVFHGSNELWFAEYDFAGNELYTPNTQKELDEMRQNHKIHKRHH